MKGREREKKFFLKKKTLTWKIKIYNIIFLEHFYQINQKNLFKNNKLK